MKLLGRAFLKYVILEIKNGFRILVLQNEIKSLCGWLLKTWTVLSQTKESKIKYQSMCIEIIKYDDVQEYVALGILDSYNRPYALEYIF